MTPSDSINNVARQDPLRREVIRRHTKRRFEMACHSAVRRGARGVR